MLIASKKKRFIAGAVCPACKQEDKIQLWAENGLNIFECVSCAYTETQSSEPTKEAKPSIDVEPVKFVDLSPNSGDANKAD